MKFFTLIIAMIILGSCGQESNSDLSGNMAEFWIEIGDHDTFLKKELTTDTKVEGDRGVTYCSLYKNGKYKIYNVPELAENKHILVNIVDYTEKGCGFSQGFVYLPHIKNLSHDPRGGSQVFPLTHKPFVNFLTPPRSFGSLRSNGQRKHAAADLYSSTANDVISIADGEVIDHYYFYSGTDAVVVKHPIPGGSRIVRYGEIGSLAKGIGIGSKVKRGQVLAKVGKLACCHPMLHFELFSGSKSGPLTLVSAYPYQRRSDLLNPTEMLLELEDLIK